MTVKEHYDRHLGNFYTWMMGDFQQKKEEQKKILISLNIAPTTGKSAIDLGAGNGIQSIALAELGFKVTAVDFNRQLLDELHRNKGEYPINVVEHDMLDFLQHQAAQTSLIVCMGDTLTHLKSFQQVAVFIEKISERLVEKGKVVFSFRDLTQELTHDHRFIPVRSDDKRILTCFLEYFNDHVIVHDILYEKEKEEWVMKVSAYPKLRINKEKIEALFQQNSIRMISSQIINRMVYMVGEKI